MSFPEDPQTWEVENQRSFYTIRPQRVQCLKQSLGERLDVQGLHISPLLAGLVTGCTTRPSFLSGKRPLSCSQGKISERTNLQVSSSLMHSLTSQDLSVLCPQSSTSAPQEAVWYTVWHFCWNPEDKENIFIAALASWLSFAFKAVVSKELSLGTEGTCLLAAACTWTKGPGEKLTPISSQQKERLAPWLQQKPTRISTLPTHLLSYSEQRAWQRGECLKNTDFLWHCWNYEG